MANEEVIRHQMEDTRTALTEKLENLENQVVGTVQGATDAVNETVANIKDSVQDTVTAVKDTVAGGVETVKDWMDIPSHVDNHPWLMVGGAAALGFCLGCMLPKRAAMTTAMSAASEPIRSDAPRASHSRLSHHTNGGHKRRHESTSTSMLGSWLSELGPEINKLKSLALGTLLGTAREMMLKAVPQHMGAQLKEIVDNVTTKIGGEPIPSTDWENSALTQGERHEERDPTEMGGTLGSTHRQGQKALGQYDR